MEQIEALFSERRMMCGKAPEASQALVEVSGLVDPALKIEIKCIGVLD